MYPLDGAHRNRQVRQLSPDGRGIFACACGFRRRKKKLTVPGRWRWPCWWRQIPAPSAKFSPSTWTGKWPRSWPAWLRSVTSASRDCSAWMSLLIFESAVLLIQVKFTGLVYVIVFSPDSGSADIAEVALAGIWRMWALLALVLGTVCFREESVRVNIFREQPPVLSLYGKRRFCEDHDGRDHSSGIPFTRTA